MNETYTEHTTYVVAVVVGLVVVVVSEHYLCPSFVSCRPQNICCDHGMIGQTWQGLVSACCAVCAPYMFCDVLWSMKHVLKR